MLPPKSPDVLVFGYAAHGASTAMREHVADFSAALGRLANAELAVYEASSYEDLARAMVVGEVDFAWLPPLAFVALERKKMVEALVSAERGGDTAFYSALIVARDSDLHAPEDLAGARAAWVDPYSASGYVVPRAGLAAIGIDPRVAFSEERFWHSHEAVVRAVVAGRADFGATYAGLDADAEVTRGSWLDVPGADDAVRVLVRFGAIPGDVVAARTAVPEAKREMLTRALLAMSRQGQHRLLGEAFGIDELRPWVSAGYDALRRLTEDASKRGLLEGDADPDDDDDDDESTLA
ncbi:MAG: Phosphonate transporter phosphate-binding periplasmic component [Labilithrix sp.]|nr:Phosphonate transporter phosphate-binding periplasmic component [Labilithrix sp.]